MLMNLCVLLSLISTSHADVQKDRDTTIVVVQNNIEQSKQYQDLLKRISVLEENNVSQSSKKNAARVIGYSSGTLGVITSIWAIYEKTLSLKNSTVEYEIRTNIRAKVVNDIEVLKLSKQTDQHAEQLARKIDNLNEVDEKIANIKMRMRISRMGLYRGIFKFGTSLGMFVITIFMDDISHYFYDKFTPKEKQYTSFLASWDTITYQSNVLDILYYDKDTIENRVLLYFIDDDVEWNKALEKYKHMYPNGYYRYRQRAIETLTNMLLLECNKAEKKMVDMEEEQWYTEYYRTKRDGTYVAPFRIKEVKNK